MKSSVSLTMLIMMTLTLLFLKSKEMNAEKKNKKTTFECGFNQISQKKMTFSTNFLLLMMMFLIFDVEISIIIPFITMNKNNSLILMNTMFLCALMIIMKKEWKLGALQWNM